MKKLVATLIAFSAISFAFAQTKVADIVEFQAETIDLGKMKVNVPKTATFIVKNIGKTPLIIEAANPTCGCTFGDYTKSPIAPGKTGTITAKYDAKSIGSVNKTMTVKFAGVDELKSIYFTGEVLSEEDFAKLAPAKNGKKPVKKS